MNDKRNIIALNNLADDLDQSGLHKYSQEIDGIATRLAILNLPPQRLNHPGTDDLKRKYLEPLPPQNFLELLYNIDNKIKNYVLTEQEIISKVKSFAS